MNKIFNYILYKNFFKDFNTTNEGFFLISHIQNMNTEEFLIIKSLTKENNIKFFYLKNILLKKICTKFSEKSTLHRLLCGPSIIFYFNSLKEFSIFLTNDYVKKNILPLTIYIDENFFSYSYFIKYIKLQNIFLFKWKINFLSLLIILKKPIFNLLNNLNYYLNNYFRILNIFEKNKL